MIKVGFKKSGGYHLQAVGLVAVILSLASFIYFYNQRITLGDTDSISHMMIARRVLDNAGHNFSLVQLGDIWLPLQHVLMLSCIWVNPLYYSGMCGSAFSMVAFLATSMLVFLMVDLGTGDKVAAAIAAIFFFAINPNVLYMQSTPMTELLLLMTEVGSVYCLVRFSQNPRNLWWFLLTDFCVLLSTMTRYEGWVLAITVNVLLFYVLVRGRKFFDFRVKDRGYVGAYMIVAGVISFIGIGLWIGWNGIIFHNPLDFMVGEYSRPIVELNRQELSTGNWLVSLLTYVYDTVGLAGLPLVLLSVLGLGYFLAREKLKPEKVGFLALLFPFPMFVMMLYTGERSINVPEFGQNLLNTRYALQMLLPIAVFAGYLIQRRIWLKIPAVALSVLGIVLILKGNHVLTLNESVEFTSNQNAVTQVDTAMWLEANYNGSLILMENAGNELIQFRSDLPLNRFVYEGNHNLFDPALESPGKYVGWVYMRTVQGNKDKIARALEGNTAKLVDFKLVYKTSDGELYEKIQG